MYITIYEKIQINNDAHGKVLIDVGVKQRYLLLLRIIWFVN